MDAYVVRVPARESAQLRSASVVRAVIDEARHAAGDRFVSLADDWAALHFLLSGDVPMPKHEALAHGLNWSDDSTTNVLMGGEPLPRDGGFGPARLLPPLVVARMANKLASVDPDALLKRFDPRALEEEGIPPVGWTDDAATRARLRERYSTLRTLYQNAADAGDAVLIHIV